MPYINMNWPQVYMCPPHPEVYMCPPNPEHPSHLSPYAIPPGCPKAPALVTLVHVSNLHWSSILHMVMTCLSVILLNYPTLAFSHRVQKSIPYICVSFVAASWDRLYHLSKFHIHMCVCVNRQYRSFCF